MKVSNQSKSEAAFGLLVLLGIIVVMTIQNGGGVVMFLEFAGMWVALLMSLYVLFRVLKRLGVYGKEEKEGW